MKMLIIPMGIIFRFMLIKYWSSCIKIFWKRNMKEIKKRRELILVFSLLLDHYRHF